MSKEKKTWKIVEEKLKNLKFGDKVDVRIGKKIEKGFIWKIRKSYILIALEDGYYVEVKPQERKLSWKKSNEKWHFCFYQGD